MTTRTLWAWSCLLLAPAAALARAEHPLGPSPYRAVLGQARPSTTHSRALSRGLERPAGAPRRLEIQKSGVSVAKGQQVPLVGLDAKTLTFDSPAEARSYVAQRSASPGPPTLVEARGSRVLELSGEGVSSLPAATALRDRAWEALAVSPTKDGAVGYANAEGVAVWSSDDPRLEAALQRAKASKPSDRDPGAQKPEPQVPDPKPVDRVPDPGAQKPEPQAPDPKPVDRDPDPGAQKPGPQAPEGALNAKPLDPGRLLPTRPAEPATKPPPSDRAEQAGWTYVKDPSGVHLTQGTLPADALEQLIPRRPGEPPEKPGSPTLKPPPSTKPADPKPRKPGFPFTKPTPPNAKPPAKPSGQRPKPVDKKPRRGIRDRLSEALDQ